MAKRTALAWIAIFIAAAVFAQSSGQGVDDTELRSIGGKTIEFINYVGPHERIDSAADIRGIGRRLGASVAGGSRRAGEAGRYFVIHAVDPAVPTGFDADILMLGEGALVDHIKNLRRIVAGYLEGAYAYSPSDADTLAVFITLYNAVYRGNMAYFSSKYKPVVTKELSERTAGLSVRWDEWAGRSRIVIPLGVRRGSGVLGSVDTSAISDKPTTAALKAEDPKTAVEERRDLVDIKERQIDEEKADIQKEKDRIAAETKALEETKARTEEDKAKDTVGAPGATGAAAAGDKPAGQEEGTGAAKGDGQEASVAVSDAAKADAQAKAEAAKAEEAKAAEAETKAVAEKEAELAKAKEEVASREEAVAAKEKEVAEDRKAIAEEQKGAIADELAAAAAREAAGVVVFELMDPNQPLARIVLVDVKTGETIRKSNLNTIKASSVVDLGDAYAAIAGQVTSAGGTVGLVRVVKKDYAQVIQSDAQVFGESPLWKIGSSLYAIVKKGDAWVVGRFDPVTLALAATSAPVSRYSPLTEHQGQLIAQKPGAGFLVLDADKLSTLQEVVR